MFGGKKARPKVFGLGLSRTGTTSLNRALRRLGYDVHGYDPALLEAWRAGNKDALFAVTDRHDGFEDWPYPLAYSELMDRYGDSARYILTVRRDPGIWLSSYIAHADRKGRDVERFHEMAYGYPYPHGFEAEHVAFYLRHNEAVRAAVVKNRLSNCFKEVCWERGDGWRQLCELTNHSIPWARFPHKNRRRLP